MINALNIHSLQNILSLERYDRAIGLLQEDGGVDSKKLRALKEDEEGLSQACREFEAIFINLLLQQFRQTIPDDGLMPRSFTMKTYEEMLDRQTASALSASESFGIGPMLYRQLTGLRSLYSSAGEESEKGQQIEREG